MSQVPFRARYGLETSNTVSVGNSTVNVSINSTAVLVGSNVSVTTSTVFVGNSTVNVSINSSSVLIGGVALPVITGNVGFGSNTLFVDSANFRVGINNTAPVVSLHLTSTDAIKVPLGNTGQRPTGANGYFRYNSESNAFEGYANGAWGAIGGSGGVTLHDDTSTNSTFYVPLNANSTGSTANLAVSTTKLYFNPSSGTLSATAYNSLSDVGFKSNIKTIKNPMSIINSINGVEFKWKDNKNKSAGIIAQELEKILPHLVDQNHKGVKSINYNGLIAYLIETIKELDSRVKDLEDAG